MALKKSNLGIHDASKLLNREINSQLDQIIFDMGIRDVDKSMIGFSLPLITFFLFSAEFRNFILTKPHTSI